MERGRSLLWGGEVGESLYLKGHFKIYSKLVKKWCCGLNYES